LPDSAEEEEDAPVVQDPRFLRVCAPLPAVLRIPSLILSCFLRSSAEPPRSGLTSHQQKRVFGKFKNQKMVL
jgi:hypothetical protein